MKYQSKPVLALLLIVLMTFCISCATSPTSATSAPTLTQVPTVSYLPTMTIAPGSTEQPPVHWALAVATIDFHQQDPIPCQQILQLTPDISNLQDVYNIVGYPVWKRDLPAGIALKYHSKEPKYPHVILLDGVTGIVIFISATTTLSNCPSIDELTSQYGEPVLAISNELQENLLFENQGMAVIGRSIQKFSPNIIVSDYQANQGFRDESLAFTP